ncbi:hypothetical protein J4436_03305 [Candidatus Woesearchaeota archaeon]|nr:hypothetical protein [Candidatus Woesearchaeota archaeon]
MNILLIYLIIIVIIGILAYFLLKTLIKTILIISITLILLSLFTTLLISKDINEFKTKLPSSNNLILIKNNIYITGFYFNIKTNNISFLTEKELNSLNITQEKNIYKTIIIDQGYLKENLPETIIFNNISINKEDIFILLNSKDPLTYYVHNLNENQIITTIEYPQSYILTTNSSSELKGTLIILSINELRKNNLFLFLLKGYKSNQIEIYEETLTFRFIKSLPLSIIEKFTNKEENIYKEPSNI